MTTGFGLLEEVIANEELLALLPHDASYDEIADMALLNFLDHQDSGEPLILNQQLATKYCKDKGNLSRALKERLDPAVNAHRTRILAHLRGLKITEGLSSDELHHRGVIGFIHGIGSLSAEDRQANAEKATANRLKKINYLGCSFDSTPEATCASFLKEGLPELYFKRGRTYQRPMMNALTGNKLKIDFAIPPAVLGSSTLVLIEYHECIIWSQDGKGHFDSEEEAAKYRADILRYTGSERAEREDEVSDMLFKRWFNRRMEAIGSNPRYRGTPLLAARNQHEFYATVLKELGITKRSEADFNSEYNRRFKQMSARRAP